MANPVTDEMTGEMPDAGDGRVTDPDANRDLGFGRVLSTRSRRLLNRDGSFTSEREGLRFFSAIDVYHHLLTVPWRTFIALFVAAYLTTNVLFALAYTLCGPGALAGPVGDGTLRRFVDSFYFSVETFGTIGYGHVSPRGDAANLVVVCESLVGLLGISLTTGIVFARFSRPVANILFSDVALIAPYQGITAFMFRVVNSRRSQLTELEAKISLAIFAAGPDGVRMRRYHDLALERRRVLFFPLGWTVVHPIDAKSPLDGLTMADLVAAEAEFLILLSGIDETFSQVVHQRSSYHVGELVWGARFVDLFNPVREDGTVSIDVRRLSKYEMVGLGTGD